MDHGSSSQQQLDAEIVTGEASVQQNPNPIPAPPPGSPDMELLGWQPNCSFMDNLLAAANEQPPPGHYLAVPAAPDNYLPAVVDMVPSPLPRLPLMIPVSQLLLAPFSWEGDYQLELEAVPELEEEYAADQEEEEEEEDEEAGADDDEFFAVQASQTGGDDEGEHTFLDEQVSPPMFTLSDVMAETCILQKKIKMMNFAACQDESGMMTVMPKVTATGDGDFGKKIEGFMFQYGKKGEVGLMCFCHGYILTPAEFIKHAGGIPVPDPLAKIEVHIPTI